MQMLRRKQSTFGESERYVACMVLGGVGDCLGFRDGQWEFLKDGEVIHAQMATLGGVAALKVQGFKVSDDTVMNLATAKAIVNYEKKKKRDRAVEDAKVDLYLKIAFEYIECMQDMIGRAPGGTCIKGVNQLNPSIRTGYIIEFNERGAGCGAAMRLVSFLLFLLFSRILTLFSVN